MSVLCLASVSNACGWSKTVTKCCLTFCLLIFCFEIHKYYFAWLLLPTVHVDFSMSNVSTVHLLQFDSIDRQHFETKIPEPKVTHRCYHLFVLISRFCIYKILISANGCIIPNAVGVYLLKTKRKCSSFLAPCAFHLVLVSVFFPELPRKNTYHCVQSCNDRFDLLFSINFNVFHKKPTFFVALAKSDINSNSKMTSTTHV